MLRGQRVAAVLAALALCAVAARAEETIEAKIVHAGMFKNGMAYVRVQAQIPHAGTFLLQQPPAARHGTFWLESDTVTVRAAKRKLSVPWREAAGADLGKLPPGTRVRLHFRDEGLEPVAGSVAGKAGKYLILEDGTHTTLVDPELLVYVQIEGSVSETTAEKDVLLLDAGPGGHFPATVSMTYLVEGLTWAPSYRFELIDGERLEITQKALIHNELTDLENVQVELISGFPSMAFAHVKSLLSADMTLRTFIESLGRPVREMAAVMRQALVASNVGWPGDRAGGQPLPPMPTGEGPDLHYQPAGKHSLEQGETKMLVVGSAEAAYDPVVLWEVKEQRDPYSRYRSRPQDEEDKDVPWDTLRFKNPFDFPMTTAPAMVVSNSRIMGQQTSYWLNPGQEGMLRVNHALSIRTESQEIEVPDSREVVYIAGDDYWKTRVRGRLTVRNHRRKTVELIVRRPFSGELLEASDEPEHRLLESGVYSVNQRNELEWTVDLPAGQEKEFTYEYSVLVSR